MFLDKLDTNGFTDIQVGIGIYLDSVTFMFV